MKSCKSKFFNYRRFEHFKHEEENVDKSTDEFKNIMLSVFGGGMKTKHVKILFNNVQQSILMYTRLDLN